MACSAPPKSRSSGRTPTMFSAPSGGGAEGPGPDDLLDDLLGVGAGEGAPGAGADGDAEATGASEAEVGAASEFHAAVARYNEDHPQEWPADSGTCPGCGHNGCFGRMPEDPDRWGCFSTQHDADSGGVGVHVENQWQRDALDLD